MFKRIFLGEYAELAAILAFAVAATIFISFLKHAYSMRNDQADKLANLPFNSDDARHDPSA
jgi:hypothetical protein